MEYDVIIVGGGLGGLTAGAKLAREGKKVLLIEQHDRPGGCATTFKRKQFTMEVGLHEMDGLHPKDLKNKIFNDLGVFEKVSFLKVPEFYRFVNGRTDLVMPHDPEEAIRRLTATFPAERAGIEKYFDRLLNTRKYLVELRDKPDQSLGDFLDSIIGDEELKLVLLGNLGYFHDDPYSLSMTYFSVAEGSYFTGGGSFIKGGSQELSNALSCVINSNGGRVILNHTVTGFRMEDDRVACVYFSPRIGHDEVAIKAAGKEIIVNASLPWLESVLEGRHREALHEEIGTNIPGASLLTVYYGFNKPLSEIGYSYYSTFIFDESVRSQRDILSNNHGDYSKRSFTFVDYSQLDSGLAPEGKGVGGVCCIDYLEDWQNLDHASYKAKKQEIQEIFTDRLDQLIPGFREAVEYVEVGTAKTVARYTLNPEGAVYGFAQHPGRKIPAVNSVKNLHIASAWGKFGGGFSGAIYSGYMTAMDILRKRD
ncbi:MAG: phytoene desaturase family protein [Bacteroidota bacterium]